jgi:release factor glutamine methyltransferase
VGPEVLIPRPETEALVALAISELSEPRLGLEVGVGSGAISIELLAKFPALRMVATELTEQAAACARANAAKILADPSRLEIRMAQQGQVLEPLSGLAADFLISNPPYLAERSELDEEVLRHEPHTALFAPEGDPLYFYRKIAETKVPRTFLELPHERADAIRELLISHGWKAELHPDLTGRNRILRANRSL